MRAATSAGARDAANRRLLWFLLAAGFVLFLGSILFIISRAY